MVSFISFVFPIYHKDFYFCLPFFLTRGHTNKQVSSLTDSHAYNPLVWVALQNPLILYCEHLQHFTKEISSSYFMSLPKSRPRLIKKELDSTLIIAWQCLVRTLNEGSFFSCQKLSSQVYLALVPYFLRNIYSYPFIVSSR